MRSAPLATLSLLCCLSSPASSQTFPSKPIRWVIPSSPGGSADAVTRVVANGVSSLIGQRVIPDNRAGASGNIGTELVAKSAPDGYTWLMINNAQAANVSLYRNLPYDLVRDFAPVTQVDSAPHIVVVHPTLPVKSLAELVKLAKAKPGQLDYASAGLGTVTFLAAEIFKSQAGINLRHVPYKGGGESLTSIVSGETIVYFSPLPVALPQMKQGRLRGLAVTSKQRVAALPDVPTVAESGYPNYEFNLWNGLLVPAKTPPEIVAAIHNAVTATLHSPDVAKRLTEMSSNAVGSQPQAFGAFVKSEVESIAKLVAKLKLQAQ